MLKLVFSAAGLDFLLYQKSFGSDYYATFANVGRKISLLRHTMPAFLSIS